MSFSPDQLQKARAFVELLKQKPEYLHAPELSFFKEYLESLGAKIPEVKREEPKPTPQEQPAPKVEPEPEVEEVKEAEVEEEVEVEEPEEVDPDLWTPDEDPQHEMGDKSKEVSDEDNSQSMKLFSEARRSLPKKEFESAIDQLTEAIKLNPTKAVFYATRADCFLKTKKPNAAIKDSDRALELNPDQAKAYKVRGTAKRYLGHYEEAILDLHTGNKLDYDEDTDLTIKSIKDRVEKIVARKREKARKEEEAAIKKKKAEYERRKKAAEEARKRMEEEEDDDLPSGMPGAGGLPPEIQRVLSDPEVQKALNDPEISSKLMEVMSNPANIVKYAADPKLGPLIQKLAPLFAGRFGGGAPGAPGAHTAHGGPGHQHGPGCSHSHAHEDEFDVD